MESGLSCQGHKSIPASRFVHWISIFYYCTFLQNTWWGPCRGMNPVVQKRLLFPSPKKTQNTSHQSPFPQIQFPFPLIKHIPLIKLIHVYSVIQMSTTPGVSSTLSDFWVTSELLAARDTKHQREPNQRRAGIVQASSPFCQLTSLLTRQFAAIPFPCQTMQWFGDAHK